MQGNIIKIILDSFTMKEIYKKIWKLAKPYYEKGRPMDIDHIDWIMQEALVVCEKEKVDDSLLVPLVILHDVGYGETGPAYFEKNLKKLHMEAGEKIARQILEKVNYPNDKIEQIASWISVHDNWIFGKTEVYKENKILNIFSDLDFTWMASKKGFEYIRKHLKKNPEEMIKYLETAEKHENIPFCTETTKMIYNDNLSERKAELA